MATPKYQSVELPVTGDRKTGDKVRLTVTPSEVSDLVASGVLTEELDVDMSTALLIACTHPDDHPKIEKLFEEDAMSGIGVAAGLRLAIVKRQQAAMKSAFDVFKVGGGDLPKA